MHEYCFKPNELLHVHMKHAHLFQTCLSSACVCSRRVQAPWEPMDHSPQAPLLAGKNIERVAGVAIFFPRGSTALRSTSRVLCLLTGGRVPYH